MDTKAPTPQHILNYRPSPATHRLMLAPMAHGMLGAIPDAMDLRPFFPGIRDQGREGSCSGHSTAGFREVLHGSCAGHVMTYRLSPAYLYARTRIAEGSFPRDSGATLADEFGVLEAHGVCPETTMPYDANPADMPSVVADAAAVPMRIAQPLLVPMDKDSVRAVLAGGRPISIAFPVYSSFEQDIGPGGVMPMPDCSTEDLLGGHAVLVLGYTPSSLLIANSWGTGWGDGGFFHAPYEFIDLWWEAYTGALQA